MLAADLNAVIDGLFAGGATQVDVVDAHGSGNPEPDVREICWISRAKQMFRDQPFDPYVDIPRLTRTTPSSPSPCMRRPEAKGSRRIRSR